MVEGVLQSSLEGTPQGGPLSPLLANILLDDLDKELERRGLPFVRYADDFVIFTRSPRSAERVFAGVTRYLTKVLRLVVNLEKSRIVPSDGVEFLGFVFRGTRATINVAEKNVQRFKQRIRELTGRSFWKRWRFVRTRIRNLLALGVPRRQAIRHGKSRQGPWHMAKTIASGVGMTNAWLQEQGLLSLKSLWAQLAPLRRTA